MSKWVGRSVDLGFEPFFFFVSIYSPGKRFTKYRAKKSEI